MAEAHAKPHHDYHLVDPSPWPAVGAIVGLHRGGRGYLLDAPSVRSAAPIWCLGLGIAACSTP